MTNDIIFYVLIAFGSFISLLVAFPYLKNMIESITKKTRYNSMGTSSKIRLVRQLHEAVAHLSKTKTGAIITIINKQPLDHLRTDGLKIDANISSSLIIALFNKQSPLHDGAIIVDNNKIVYAGTYYKITGKSVDNKYGARHRAALGISEQSDALTIVVSEENGGITFAHEAQFHKIKIGDFQEKLTEFIS